MKIKSLLAAVSMVAITAGSANALVLTNTTAGGTITPALELDTPLAAPVDLGLFSFEVAPDPGGQFAGGANLLVTVDLPAGIVFADDVQGVAITGPNSAAFSATVQNGTGGEGTTTVTFLASLFASVGAGDPLTFDLPLAFEDCPTGAPLSVTVETESGTPIEQGTVLAAPAEAVVGECAYALGVPVASDDATSDTIITLASDFTALSDSGSSAPLDGVLGTIRLLVDPTVSVDLNPAMPMDAGDIESVIFDVCFEDASAIDTVRVGNTLGVKSGNTFSFEVTDAAAIATLLLAPNRIIATEDGTTAIVSQTPSIKNIVVNFDDTDAELQDNRSFTGDDLDALTREGIQFGYFDWNAGPAIANPTVSVYRITRLTPGETVGYSLSVANSLNNGTYNGSVTADAAGEAALFSTTMPIPADIGRFDVLINLETSNDCVDIDRLMIRNDVVSAFNDGANNDITDGLEPHSDQDNNGLSATPACAAP